MNISEIKNPIIKGNEEEALKFIFSNCFKSGFGTLNKTELDLILFSVIMQFANQEDTSDYALSKYLQITQQRVRNLKEKASVKYIEYKPKDAIEFFTEQINHAKVQDIFLDIPIYDIRVKNEIEAILEKNNILLHTQLNLNIFRLRIDDFLELSIALEKFEHPQKKLEEVEEEVLSLIKQKAETDNKFAKKINPTNKSMAEIGKSTVKDAIVKGGISIGIDALASLIPGASMLSSPVKKMITNVLDNIKSKV